MNKEPKMKKSRKTKEVEGKNIKEENEPDIKLGLMSMIRKYALQNAVLHDGKANAGAVLGKVLGADSSLKKEIAKIKEIIDDTVDEVNCSSPEQQKEMLSEIAPELLEKKEAKKGLKELPNAEMGKVVTRIPPEPSKYNHIGHALSFLINYLYAKKYDGTCILRFEDTNPLKSSQEYVDAMTEDVIKFLGITPDKTLFASDHMDIFYKYAEKLINDKKAYVCFCSREEMQKNRHEGIPCKCRNTSSQKNIEEWKNMLNGKYDEQTCVLRLKADMESGNQVMRDPVIFRIIKAEHYRQKSKYCVWPVYDFENAVEDADICKVTHVMRSSEFGTMRVELQNYLKELLNFKKQTIIQYGRFTVVDAVTQGREIRKMIEEGKVSGWDDTSLVTIKALKRRGFVKETFYEMAVQVGLSPTPTKINWSLVSSINRRVIDPVVKRYFFVEEPVKIRIENAPEINPHLKLHPDHPEYGERKFRTNEEFYISKNDFDSLKDGKLYRLMECLNFKKEKGKFVFVSATVEDYKKRGEKIMHWLPADSDANAKLADVEILMPDHSIKKGFAEPLAAGLNVDDEVQFERFGFCRLDRKENKKGNEKENEKEKEKGKPKLYFWFTHN